MLFTLNRAQMCTAGRGAPCSTASKGWRWSGRRGAWRRSTAHAQWRLRLRRRLLWSRHYWGRRGRRRWTPRCSIRTQVWKKKNKIMCTCTNITRHLYFNQIKLFFFFYLLHALNLEKKSDMFCKDWQIKTKVVAKHLQTAQISSSTINGYSQNKNIKNFTVNSL